MTSKIDVALLRALLRYEPETGFLFWLERPRELFGKEREHKRWNNRYAGKRAFSPNMNGYRDGMIFRKMYREHQVAWALHHEEWPTDQIDHINGDRADNRIVNLRQVSKILNSQNTKFRSSNRSGVMGVIAHRNRWRAYIRAEGKCRHLGLFDTLDEARDARKAAEAKYGFHPNHGRVVWSEPMEGMGR